MRLIAKIFTLLTVFMGVAHADPLGRLAQISPQLHALYLNYPQYHLQLATYAVQQGFAEPENVLATTVHELIHIDSASHQGFYVAGQYFSPYLAQRAWPFLTNADVAAYLSPQEKNRLGLVHSVYIRLNPNNRLGNVLDEVNAYAQSLPFLCEVSPVQAVRHVQSLADYLELVEFYLRTLTRFPEQYQKLSQHPDSRGALETLVANAYKTLNVCYRRGILEADPSKIPKAFTQAFAEQKK